MLDGRDWQAVPCVIVSSEVVGDGNRSTVWITYRYAFAGRDYQSSRYRFGTLKLSNQVASDIVSQYPPGRNAIGYVAPDSPREAVLNRGFVPSLVHQVPGALISLIFTVGACLIAIGAIFEPLTRRPGMPPSPSEKSPT